MSVFPGQKCECADSGEASAHLQPQTFLLSFVSLTRPSRDSSHDCAACLGLDESDSFLLERIGMKSDIIASVSQERRVLLHPRASDTPCQNSFLKERSDIL